MALIAGNATITSSLFMVKTTNGNLVAIDSNSSIFRSDPKQTSRLGVDTTAAGVKSTDKFKFTLPKINLAAGVFILVNWDVISGAPAGATGRINVNLQKNGVTITGITKALGATRALDVVAGFQELLSIKLPDTVFTAGDDLEFDVEFEVIATSAGATLDWDLAHDPTDIEKALVAEVNV